MENAKPVTLVKAYPSATNSEFAAKCDNVLLKFPTVDAFVAGREWKEALGASLETFRPYTLMPDSEISPDLRQRIRGYRADVAAAFRNIATYAELYCRGNAQLAKDAGFEEKKAAAPAGRPAEPRGFALTTVGQKSGSFRVMVEAQKNVAGYEVEYHWVDYQNFSTTFFSSSKQMVVTNLEVGRNYSARVRAKGKGTNGESDWVGPVTIIVQ